MTSIKIRTHARLPRKRRIKQKRQLMRKAVDVISILIDSENDLMLKSNREFIENSKLLLPCRDFEEMMLMIRKRSEFRMLSALSMVKDMTLKRYGFAVIIDSKPVIQ